MHLFLRYFYALNRNYDLYIHAATTKSVSEQISLIFLILNKARKLSLRLEVNSLLVLIILEILAETFDARPRAE